MTACSSCGGARVNNCVQHEPTCPSYRPSQILHHPDLALDPPPDMAEHPDLVELDAHVSRWYDDEGAAQ